MSLAGMFMTFPTPASIKTEYNRDVFDEAITSVFGASYAYKEAMIEECWSKFRYRMCATSDVDYFVQAMKDRLTLGSKEIEMALEAMPISYPEHDTVQIVESENVTEIPPDVPLDPSDVYASAKGKTKTTATMDNDQFSSYARKLDNYRDAFDIMFKWLNVLFLNRW